VLAGVSPALAQILTLTDAQEIEAGKRAAALVEFEQPLLADARISAYLQKLGLRLARESDRAGLRFQFKVLQSDDVNAFNLPGGYIYVTRGLLEAVRDEEELAAALAHEIAHVAAKQHAAKIRRAQLADLGTGFLGPVMGGGVRAAIAVRSGRASTRGLFLRFTKGNDRQADRIATGILNNSGYDPAALLRFLNRLKAIEERDPGLVKAYYSSHSKPSDREEGLADLLPNLKVKPNNHARSSEFERFQKHLFRIKPKGAMATSEAAAAVLDAARQEPESQEVRDREVAALFAPVFYKAQGDEPRYDWPTNFDFDGDWRGDNNWVNASQQYPLKAWVYYSVRETRSHYFLHYALFHPRDYKGGVKRGPLYSRMIRTATKPAAPVDPTGRASEAVLAHENDLEGCLIVVEKNGPDPANGRVVFVQTLAHNNFLKYVREDEPKNGFQTFSLAGQRVRLFVEPKGHGIEAYRDSAPPSAPIRTFTFTGQAEEPEAGSLDPVGYNLAPISSTLWREAQRGLTPTFAVTEDFGLVLVEMEIDGEAREVTWNIGRIGTAFRGSGDTHMARAPWGWFDSRDRLQPLGEWFFDPARTVRRDYGLDESFSVAYLREWPPVAETPKEVEGRMSLPAKP
jgi:Zn-dependent protease with chaperone function